MRRSVESSVQSGGIGASRQRSVPLSKVSQPRRYSPTRPMVLSGMVSQTIHRVPAWSSNSRSAMRHDSCTGQATSAKPVRTMNQAAFRWLNDGGSRAAGDGPVADVPVIALTAADAMSAAAQFHDLGNMPLRGSDGTGRPDGLVGCPRAPAVEQPAARGSLDRLSGLVRCWPARQAACVRGVLARIPGIHAAGPLVWTLNIGERGRERSRSVPLVRHHDGFRARAHRVTVDS